MKNTVTIYLLVKALHCPCVYTDSSTTGNFATYGQKISVFQVDLSQMLIFVPLVRLL